MRMRVITAACALAAAGACLFAQGAARPLRIGLMPAYNSAPLVVAEAAGLYRDNGIDVRLVPFSGQLERETALQTGALDGTVSDLINAIQAWRHGSAARVTSVTEGHFCLLASPRSSLRSLGDWPSGAAGKVKTGLLENSIVFYLTERMLSAAGADPGRVEVVPIVQLPARLEMLMAGRIDAACLPEPLATLAVSRGARLLADSDRMGATPGVLLFTGKALAEKGTAIAAFYRAYDAAVDELARRPGAYARAVVDGCGFPPAVAEVMRLPRFRHRFLPSEQLVADVGAWMVRKGLVDALPAYGQIVVSDFAAGDARAQ